MADPTTFDAATAIVTTVENIVNARLTDSQTFAKTAQTQATTAITALAGVALPNFDSAPNITAPNLAFTGDLVLDKVTTTSFGGISPPFIGPLPPFPNVFGLTGITIPDFVSSIGSLSIPPPPGAIDISGLPTQPAVDLTLTLPVVPSSVLPTMDTLNPIVIPQFLFPTLPTFNTAAPVFDGSPVSTILQWREPVYAPEVLNAVLAQVNAFFAGTSGIPLAVEQAIFARGMDREQVLVDQAVKTATDEMATRGYTLPPGVLNARIDEIRQKATIAAQEAQRELTIKAAEWQIENLKFAVQQGIACETVLVNIFLNQAERQFESAKYEVEAMLNYYNAQVTLFNARQTAYSVAAQVFKINVDAELSKLEVFKAQIEGQVAIGQLNEQLVQIFQARLQAVQTSVTIYAEEVRAAGLKTEAAKTAIEAYRTSVDAYSAKVNAEKVTFEAYSVQIQAEVAKAGIIDAEARAFVAVVQGKSAQADIQIKAAELPLEAYRAELEGYKTSIEAQKAAMEYQLSAIQAGVAAFEADTHRYIAQVEGEKAKNELSIKALETSDRLGIAYFEAQTKSYEVNVTKVIESARMQIQALTAAGQISSTLAAGAMAALHVGAQLSGSGSISAGVQDGTQASVSTQTSTITETLNETLTNITP